jgi:hypothetical protein
MPEDAGKKKYIKDFLQSVKAGQGFIEDIWIDRLVRLPGLPGEGSTARSLSGRPINTVTELLEDDLKHCFDEGYFTFRFVAALLGSGKTSLLTYLHELTKTRTTYEKSSVIIRFPLSNILLMAGQESFSIKFYCFILAETFWRLLKASDSEIRDLSKNILDDYLEKAEVDQLVAATRFMPFRSKLSQYFAKSGVVFEEFFLDVISEIVQVEPRFTFVYLIDELDSLKKYPIELQETRSLIKALIKRASQEFNSKIRLFIYLVGTSNDVDTFITEDSVVESLVGHQVINLSKGYGNEFEQIRIKIDERIKGAFEGYKNFPKAWKEIKSISLSPAQNLRRFCQEYATAVLEVHERHFNEEPEKRFEGNARELVEAKCRQKWKNYLSQKSYTLSSVSTTTTLKGHAFDCYIELLHNDSCVARGFGEAKNYELLSSHLEVFKSWLQDVNFKSLTDGTTPPDLAFIIAPSCPALLCRKLELENILFISSEKIIPGKNFKDDEKSEGDLAVNINVAEKELIIAAFKGTGIRKTTIDKLMNFRKEKVYQRIEEITEDLKLTPKVQEKLRKKMKEGQFGFS